MVNPTDPSNYIYFKNAYPFYDGGNDGSMFCYSPGYNPNEGGPWDAYNCYWGKTGSSDDNTGYSNYYTTWQFMPTDSDFAVGYGDFGRRLNWYHTGRTWFSNSSPGGGSLQAPVDNLVDTNNNTTASYTKLWNKLDPKENDEAGYMSCNQGDMNNCPYVINAGLTPTPGTFKTAINYFKGVSGYSSPITAWCQKNFIVFVTDGLPSVDESGNTGSVNQLMPAVLSKLDTMRTITKQISGQSYNFDIKTFVLGVGNEATQDLDQMAIHGGTALNGHAYYANDPQQLADALNGIFNKIIEQAYSYTSPTVPSIRVVDNDIIYISTFTPSDNAFWPGSLKAYQLQPDGTLAVDANGNPQNTPLWEASLPAPANRVIKTVTGGVLKDFTSANLTAADLGVGSNADRDALITFIRNQHLGDIFHANSVIVGSPSSFFEDQGFNGSGNFYESNKNRTKVVIVGANDGMLHAFNADTGLEAWTFIPNGVLKNLQLLTAAGNTMLSIHTYYVDSSPKVADAWLYSDATNQTKTKDQWKTVLVCGLRKGGKTYFALDITDTLNPQYLWEFPTDPGILSKVGQSWSEPAIGKVKIELNGDLYERWVAFMGGGYDASGSSGNTFLVVDIKTGSLLWQYPPNGQTDPNMSYPLAAPPSAVDTNSDGFVDKVYIGDVGGQMWSFDVSFNGATKKSNSLWTGTRLFTAPVGSNEKHPIYYQPAVTVDRHQNIWIYFGTGNREDPMNVSSQKERLYAVKDDGDGNYPRTESDLADVTSNNSYLPSVTKKGWYIKLQNSSNPITGEKDYEMVLAKPNIFNQVVYFTTYTYIDFPDPCSIQGTGKLYGLEYRSGGGALNLGDFFVIDPNQTPTSRSIDIGSGVPSAPVISINSKVKATIYIGTTSGKFYSSRVSSPPSQNQPLYWREVVR
jgi:type IV pilus assembly protein PilY1